MWFASNSGITPKLLDYIMNNEKYKNELRFDVLSNNNFDLNSMIFERKKKIYHISLKKDLDQFMINKKIKQDKIYKGVYDCCINELELMLKLKNYQ